MRAWPRKLTPIVVILLIGLTVSQLSERLKAKAGTRVTDGPARWAMNHGGENRDLTEWPCSVAVTEAFYELKVSGDRLLAVAGEHDPQIVEATVDAYRQAAIRLRQSVDELTNKLGREHADAVLDNLLSQSAVLRTRWLPNDV